MTNALKLPIYQNNLPDFLWALRDALGMTQKDVGTHVCLHHSRITRYENPEVLDKPRIGYVAELARLISEQSNNDPSVQETLLAEVNKSTPQLQGGRLRDWADLCKAAKSYIDKRQKSRQKSKSSQKVDKQTKGKNAHTVETKELPSSLRESNFAYSLSNQVEEVSTFQADIDPETWQTMLLDQLETSSSIKLFGIDPHIQRLHDLLLTSHTEWIISIEGLGGLGKTTLADHIVRYSIMGKHFQGVAWVSAKQQEFLEGISSQKGERISLDIGTLIDVLLEQLGLTSALSLEPRQKRNVLEKQIRSASYLIVIDNLETLDDVQTLLPYLQKIANPSKILLTSRYNLQAYPDVARVYLNQLNLNDAIHLLRHEARVRGPALLADASEAQLEKIYEVVGGNPLALKLVVGQIDALSLPEVLETLTQIQDSEVDELYTYIYQKSWLLLDANKQTLLLMMPLIYNGTVEQLLALTELERPIINQALRQLVRLSLIEAGGELNTRRYQLHRLTETFLLKQTIQWRTLNATDILDQNQLFRAGILRNLVYWQEWLETNLANLEALDREREGILKAIRFGLDIQPAWASVYQLIETFASYMERRGQWDEWGEILESAIVLASQYDDIKSLANLSAVYARLLRRQSCYQKSVQYYSQAIELSQKVGDRYNEARAYTNLGHLCNLLGNCSRAETLCNLALSIFQELNHDSGCAHTENHLGMIYTYQGAWDKAKERLTKSCAIWEMIDDEYGLMLGFNNLGQLFTDMMSQGVHPPLDAMDYLNKALHYAKQVGDEMAIGIIYLNIGTFHRLEGNFIEAEKYFLQSKKIFQHFSDPYYLAKTRENLGLIFSEQRKWKESKEYLHQALIAWQELDDSYNEAYAMLYLAKHEQTQGNLSQAHIWLNKSEIRFNQDKQTYRSHDYKLQLEEIRCSLK